jgi:hypothetical protein
MGLNGKRTPQPPSVPSQKSSVSRRLILLAGGSRLTPNTLLRTDRTLWRRSGEGGPPLEEWACTARSRSLP